jgi:hypothetical protein
MGGYVWCVEASMAEVVTPPSWMHWWNGKRSAVIAGLGSGGLGALIWTMPLAVDVGSVLGIAALWLVVAWTMQQERLLNQLPMVLGDTVARQLVRGRSALRVRAWLGHGRAFDLRRVEVEWQPPGSAPRQALQVDQLRGTRFFGPVTITAFLPSLPVGVVVVRVVGRSAGTTWEIAREYNLSQLVQGPLACPFERRGRGLRWHRAAWDRVAGR